MVIATAPGLSKVVIYEAGPSGLANDILSAMSTNTAIKQFSCSWSFGTTPRGTMDGLFQNLAVQGQSFFDASGDNGAFTGACPEPDDDPYITQVGGTTLPTWASSIPSLTCPRPCRLEPGSPISFPSGSSARTSALARRPTNSSRNGVALPCSTTSTWAPTTGRTCNLS
jgi:subtilase family serine protease